VCKRKRKQTSIGQTTMIITTTRSSDESNRVKKNKEHAIYTACVTSEWKMLIGWFIPSIGTKVKSGQVHTQLTNMDENKSFRSTTEEQDDDVGRKRI
jgi:hypothetical protein